MGNVDLAVLRPENQNKTTVTPFIDYLAQGLFRESLHVLGPRLRFETIEPQKRTKKLQELLTKAAKLKKLVDFAAKHRLQDEYWEEVKIDHSVYKVSCMALL